jgi:hypothetical protein
VPTRTYVLLSLVALVFLVVTGIAAYYLIGALAAR